MKLLDELKARLRGDADPWKGYDPNAPQPEPVTKEQIEKAVEDMRKPRVSPPYLSYVAFFAVAIWGIGHLYALYMMIGSPVAGGIFAIVLVNLLFLGHYAILLVIGIGRYRHEHR